MSNGPHPVQRAEAPWDVHAESYLLLLKLSSLPPGLYDPLESSWSDSSNGSFTGGLGTIMLVRYTSTPVGPYDELMLIPGIFTVPQPTSAGPPKLPKSALRIARIFVSQRTTTYNGRLNWNIPKHLARFDFSHPATKAGAAPPEKLVCRVYAPGTTEGDGVPPFFACALRPWRWVPAVPVNMAYLPLSVWLAQPPIPESPAFQRARKAELEGGVEIDPYDISPKNEVAVAAGTDRWCAVDIRGKVARAGGRWVEILRAGGSGEEEGKYFPQELQPWSMGVWCEEAELEIKKPLEWKL